MEKLFKWMDEHWLTMLLIVVTLLGIASLLNNFRISKINNELYKIKTELNEIRSQEGITAGSTKP